MGLAIVHFVGAFGASAALAFFVIWLDEWAQKRQKKRWLQGASLALGIPVSMLETEGSRVPGLLEYAAQRFSNELLSNRLSDLCGALRTVWDWLSGLLQVGIVVMVLWLMFTDGAKSAVGFWLAPVVALFFWLASAAFSLTCLVLTGSYPGQAKAARKEIAAAIERRHAAAARAAPDRSAEDGVY